MSTPSPLRLEHVPLLQVQRDLYDVPIGPQRFERYLEIMLDETRAESVLPLQHLNPMGKPHVAEALDRLLELGADEVAAAAVREAHARLVGVGGGEHRTALVMVDDRMGGWTDRTLTDINHRLDPGRHWVVVMQWTGGAPDAASVREDTLGTIYRVLHHRRHGRPATLGEVMTQEGRAALFAGASTPALPPDDLAYTRETLAPQRESTAFPLIVAAMYGDEAARSVGFAPLGLSTHAGFALALEEARAAEQDPLAALA